MHEASDGHRQARTKLVRADPTNRHHRGALTDNAGVAGDPRQQRCPKEHKRRHQVNLAPKPRAIVDGLVRNNEVVQE